MKRRQFVGLVGGAATWPFAAPAQQLAPVIGFLSSRSLTESASVVAACSAGLNEAGFVEGRNITIEFRWAEGQYARLPAMAQGLVNRNVTLIIAAGGDRPALAAKAATSTIPIVFTGSDFPVKVGLVASLNRPGGNVTGASLFTSELEAKKLSLLREVVLKASLIGMLVNPANPSAESDIADVQKAATVVDQRIILLKAGSETEIDAAFERVVHERANAMLVAHEPYFLSRREQFISQAAHHKIPAIYEFREFVLDGGLMSYGSRITDNYRLGGSYAGKILK